MLETLIFGAGPGGTGPLVWAAQIGALKSWLSAGVMVVDRGDAIGGAIGDYIINSDTLGGVYLEFLGSRSAREVFEPLVDDPTTRELERMRHEYPPLSAVGRYFERFGTALAQFLADSDGAEFVPRTSVRTLSYRPDGTLTAEIAEASGNTTNVTAKSVIMALGGRHDWVPPRNREILPGVSLADCPVDKVMPSGLLFTAEGRQRAAALIGAAPSRRVVILGGSHSAFSAAVVMTAQMPEVTFGPGDIRILLRREPPVFYENREAAETDGYPVSSADICPRTLRVNRLGGLRSDGRDLWRRLKRRQGTEPEDRVVLTALHESVLPPAILRQYLDDAALIVTAFGYRARTVPVFDADGRRIALSADRGGSAVDPDARVFDAGGKPLANLFGIGLGTNYRPLASMGGEASFTGQLNSLWLYQNDVGRVVYQGIGPSIRQSGHRASRSLRGGGKLAVV